MPCCDEIDVPKHEIPDIHLREIHARTDEIQISQNAKSLLAS
ncbi:MAG TPA: hypothetical protein VKM54_03110 [Myxococcota bacterium]|nr:hypothetical protein [Myxococcota bacterium]